MPARTSKYGLRAFLENGLLMVNLYNKYIGIVRKGLGYSLDKFDKFKEG